MLFRWRAPALVLVEVRELREDHRLPRAGTPARIVRSLAAGGRRGNVRKDPAPDRAQVFGCLSCSGPLVLTLALALLVILVVRAIT
jgi:hypothetical protein